MNQGLGIAIAVLLVSLPVQGVISEATMAQAAPEDRKVNADQLLNLGRQKYQAGQFESALQVWQQALAVYRAIKDRQGEGKSLDNLGKAYESLGKYDEAIASHTKSLEIAKELGERRSEAESLINLGVVYRSRGNYAQAIAYHEQGLAIAREIADRRAEGSALGNLGMNYYAQGNYPKAIDYHEQRLVIAREIKDRQGEGNAMGNLGNAYRAQGKFAKAIEYQEKRLAITRELKEVRGEGQALGFLGLVYRSLGDYPKSVEYYQQSLAIATKINDRLGKAKSLGYLGNVYYDLGDYPEAIKYHLSSLKAAQEIKDRRGEGKSLGYLGNAYEAQGKYDDAIKYYNSSLKIAREVKDIRGAGKTLSSLGSAYYHLGDYNQAITNHRSGLEIARSIKNRDGERIALSNLGLTFQKLDQPDLAIVFYKQSVNVSESIRQDIRKLDRDLQNSYLSNIEGSYRRLADLLLKQGRVMEALQILDLLKVQELEDYLKNVKGSDRSAQGVRLLAPEKAISDKLSSVSFDNSKEINSQLANQIQKLPKSEINKVPDYLQQIPQGTVLVYPLILSDRLEIILFSPNSLPISRTVQVSKEQLESLVSEFRAGLRDSSSEDYKEPAIALYKILIKPIEAELTQVKAQTILYAPDGTLRYIPLAALYDGQKWMAQRYQISNLIAYSLSDFSSKSKIMPNILAGAFGGKASEKKFGQQALPATIKEVQAIANTFQNSVALIEDEFSRQATEAKFKDYNVLHFATHAEFNQGVPDNSFIIFGNGDKIGLSEIAAWQIPHVELIVLSACQTGEGKLGSGVEILGFGYQVQKAGAKTAIASLWSVDDVATQVLMKSFYQEFQKGNVSTTEALNKAQISLIRSSEFNHPIYWSAFFAIGNGL
ncbi:CHAT domain-containing protein [Pseudanabaena sp. Chao 1811]|uniref:CHAT domain-containing protein n=1 Tax=Pseudanabaena sp. Chao 1811 TaxID=2963092 RepID=UPI0022F3AB67|nr:tetratricopeptide repeat protein [Pseudanabaena sp. Chao 1811]